VYGVLASIDARFASHTSGDLSRWAEQGVLLLNAVLTVEEHKPNSHASEHGVSCVV
jgi:uracil-DNA glycosylase